MILTSLVQSTKLSWFQFQMESISSTRTMVVYINSNPKTYSLPKIKFLLVSLLSLLHLDYFICYTLITKSIIPKPIFCLLSQSTPNFNLTNRTLKKVRLINLIDLVTIIIILFFGLSNFPTKDPHISSTREKLIKRNMSYVLEICILTFMLCWLL